jgi:hypothetical protein
MHDYRQLSTDNSLNTGSETTQSFEPVFCLASNDWSNRFVVTITLQAEETGRNMAADFLNAILKQTGEVEYHPR